MDVARYGGFASNREYIKQTTGQFYSRRFVMTYPNEQLPAGRPLQASPGAYDAMTAQGARWGASWGLEVPLYFAPKGSSTRTPTLRAPTPSTSSARSAAAPARPSAWSIARPSRATR